MQTTQLNNTTEGYKDPALGGVVDTNGEYIVTEYVEPTPIVPFTDDSKTSHVIDISGAEKIFTKCAEQNNIEVKNLEIMTKEQASANKQLTKLGRDNINDLMWYCEIESTLGDKYSIVILNDESLISDINNSSSDFTREEVKSYVEKNYADKLSQCNQFYIISKQEIVEMDVYPLICEEHIDELDYWVELLDADGEEYNIVFLSDGEILNDFRQ